MAIATFRNCVGRQRTAAGVRQHDLAARVGVSRQSLSELEAGHSVPSAALALRLARELGCKVEELFWTDDRKTSLAVELAAVDLEPRDASPEKTRGIKRARRLSAHPADTTPAKPPAQSRMVLGSIDGRWVAHPLGTGDSGDFLRTADGLLSGGTHVKGRARVSLLDDAHSARDTLLCAGCAPAFGILAARASAAPPGDRRITWLDRSSGAALELLARGQVHVAGAHLYDEGSREFNVPFVQRKLPGRSMLIFNLAQWEVGLVVAPGNPRRIRGVRDLLREDVSFVQRQPGAAAQDLVERLLRQQGLPYDGASHARFTGRGHVEVARLVALGVADAGIALPVVARLHGLDFISLAQERFDLILTKEMLADARVVKLLETLSSRSFRREMEALGGHVTRTTGQLMADTSPTPTTASIHGAKG